MSEAIEYDGFLIPRGANLWADLQSMSNDPILYPNPTEFIPDRFLALDGSFNHKGEIPVFGFGQRSVRLTRDLWSSYNPAEDVLRLTWPTQWYSFASLP